MKRMVVAIVALGVMMESLDSTIINTAIPVMSQTLQVNPISLKLALISYLLSLAVFIPISGWVADKYGPKRVFILSFLFFTFWSIICGFTMTLWQLVFARFMQGCGGAFMIPLSRLIILRTFKRNEILSKMNIVVAVASLGIMLGPTVGGLITQHLSWRWIFWINAPIGLIAYILAKQFLPIMKPRKVHALDKLGFVLFGLWLALLTLGLSLVSERHLNISASLLIIVISCLFFIAYILRSLNKPNAIVDISLFKSHSFSISTVGILFSRLSFGGTPFVLPLLLQLSLNYSPSLSGLLLAPFALGILSLRLIFIFILKKLGYKRLLITNTVCMSLCLYACSYINQHTPLLIIAVLTFLLGCFASIQYTSVTSLGYAELEENKLSAATSIITTLQQLAQSFGVAIAAIFIALFTDKKGLTLLTFQHTLTALAVMTLPAIILFLKLNKEDGKALIEAPSQ